MKIYKVQIGEGKNATNVIERGDDVQHVLDTLRNEGQLKGAQKFVMQELTGEDLKKYRVQCYAGWIASRESFDCIGYPSLMFDPTDDHYRGLIGHVSDGGYNNCAIVFKECFNVTETMFALNVHSLTFIAEIQEAYKMWTENNR